MNTVITLAPGAQTRVQASPTFSCTDVQGALDQTHTIMAAADAHTDDAGKCSLFYFTLKALVVVLLSPGSLSSSARAVKHSYWLAGCPVGEGPTVRWPVAGCGDIAPVGRPGASAEAVPIGDPAAHSSARGCPPPVALSARAGARIAAGSVLNCPA